MKKIFLLIVFSITSACAMWAQKSHTVKQGETLQSIASEYQLTVDELKKANPNVEMVFSGLILDIPKIPQAKKNNKTESTYQEAIPTDTIKIKDGSYILCKVIGLKQGILRFKQEGEDDIFTVLTKDVSIINYANGTKRRFKK